MIFFKNFIILGEMAVKGKMVKGTYAKMNSPALKAGTDYCLSMKYTLNDNEKSSKINIYLRQHGVTASPPKEIKQFEAGMY